MCVCAIKLKDFIEASESLLARMVPPIMQALGESGLPPADIATVEIVGGTTRLGFVKVVERKKTH